MAHAGDNRRRGLTVRRPGHCITMARRAGVAATTAATASRTRPFGRPARRTTPLMGLAELLIIAALVLINAFFVAAEFALVKVRVSQIDQLAEEGNFAAKLTKRALDRLDAYLSA